MNKLLHAGFYRLRKDKAFWLISAVILSLSLFFLANNARSWRFMTESGYERTLEDYFFELAPYMGMFTAVFISLFLGTEYSEGTIRNKLIAGHTRRAVYLAAFAVSFAAGLVFVFLWLLGQAPGYFTMGPMEMGLPGFLAYTAIIVCFTASFTAIFTLVNMLSTSRAHSVVLSLAVWILLILAASGLNDRLGEPAMNGGMAYLNGEFVQMDETPNPLYVGGSLRLLLECLLDLLPSGPAILMTDASIVRPLRPILLGILLTIVLLLAGIRAFEKKDIR